MIKGTYFAWLAVIMCIVFTIGMLSKGLSNSWIGLVLAILIIGFFISEDDELEEELKSLPDDWEDYKSRYIAPDEYNTPDFTDQDLISQEDIDETINSMSK